MSESSVPKITVNSILQLSVDSFEEKFINNKSETVYTINIRNLYNNTNKQKKLEKPKKKYKIKKEKSKA